MNRAKTALFVTSAGWLSGFVAIGAFFVSGTASPDGPLFFGPMIGFLLHGAAAVIALVAILRPHPGSTTKRPAVTALILALVGLLAAAGFFTLWIAVASNGGA